MAAFDLAGVAQLVERQLPKHRTRKSDSGTEVAISHLPERRSSVQQRNWTIVRLETASCVDPLYLRSSVIPATVNGATPADQQASHQAIPGRVRLARVPSRLPSMAPAVPWPMPGFRNSRRAPPTRRAVGRRATRAVDRRLWPNLWRTSPEHAWRSVRGAGRV